MQNHTRIESVKCEKCEFIADSKNDLDSHVESIHPTPITCGICSKKLVAGEELDKHIYTTHKKVYKCDKCVFETEAVDGLSKHINEKHKSIEACKKCDNFITMERSYRLLKENYERLITINKNIQEQAKDKELAQDILLVDMRTNYDSVKTENIKLNTLY